MKIGILTFTNGTNFGQRLQNYALQEILKNYADEVYTIRQNEPYTKFKLVKMHVKKTLKGLQNLRGLRDERKRERLFRDFNKKNIDFYDKKLDFYGDNSWIADKFDAFIAGSDQIWNPWSPYVGENFFLNFARTNQRYTYAPSFSVDDLPENVVKLYKRRLTGFSEISVREYQGADIVKKITGQKSVVVLDPTLLIDRGMWNKIKEPYEQCKKKDYALCIFLGQSDMKSIHDVIKRDFIVIDNTTPIGPAQFLDLVNNAAVVLTDSYHVTIFSIIYHVPFINFERVGTKNSMHSRFDTLYKKLGIKNRDWKYLKLHMNEIYDMDYKTIEEALKKERAQSITFLDSTIGKYSR